MRILIQRVREASVDIGGERHSAIGAGMLVLTGIEEADTDTDVEWLCGKLLKLRIFDDEAGVMNRSAEETGADILIVSQFTLHASTRKGNRPSYIRAARPEKAVPLYESFVTAVRQGATGRVAFSAPTCRSRWSTTAPLRSGSIRRTGNNPRQGTAPHRPAAPEGQRTAPARKPHAASGGHKTDLTEQR